jgi:hypothetical protein
VDTSLQGVGEGAVAQRLPGYRRAPQAASGQAAGEADPTG